MLTRAEFLKAFDRHPNNDHVARSILDILISEIEKQCPKGLYVGVTRSSSGLAKQPVLRVNLDAARKADSPVDIHIGHDKIRIVSDGKIRLQTRWMDSPFDTRSKQEELLRRVESLGVTLSPSIRDFRSRPASDGRYGGDPHFRLRDLTRTTGVEFVSDVLVWYAKEVGR